MHARLMILIAASACALMGQALKIPDTVIADRDVEYSAVGGRQTLDIVRPREASTVPRPAILLVHGGGFRAGAKESYLPLAIKLAERGYVAATTNGSDHELPAVPAQPVSGRRGRRQGCDPFPAR